MVTARSTETAVGTRPRGHLSVGLVAAVAALGGLLFGYDTGIISSALPVLSKEFGIADNDLAQQFVVSAILVGCIIGAFISGPISDRIGRRKVLAGVGILFILGAIAVSLSHNYEILILFRLFLGIAVGAASQVVPVYIAELSPRARRGQLVVMFQTAVILGILVSSVSGYFIGAQDGGWRWTAVLGGVPAVVLLAGCFILPETPRYLVLSGRSQQAADVLTRLRPAGTDVDAEVSEIIRVETETKHQRDGWGEVASGRVRPALVVAVGIAVFCQITGINAVLYYAPTILGKVGFDLNAGLLASMSVTILLFIFTLLGLFLVDRWGRRKLLLGFVPVSAVCVLALGFCFNGNAIVGPPILLVILLVAFTAFNGGSLSVVAWLISSEVYPLRIRGKAMGFTALALWAADLLVSLTSLSLTSALGPRGIFWLFGIIALAAFAFVYFTLPETKGRSLEQIEESLNQGTFYPRSRRAKSD